ncbi:MSMEG_1061 family FMN-dependent PPOX-type flavoprotein [Streptomyces buecherae]|uniref:Pyridoxamine 5'-phosphate oxidase family protein n=1 Tax=Streptomyces buecherae TaxID=2763006 RepID=A0A7H8NAA1_9ACTN|nr:MSMEG_1061 family FMN-dependent PPOX-type flavoprotein [Streptomyces buecherae]QKW51385.1 pyridoxamine 5'-phosphate oxidase family protein [Streptomyces buecherae]
MPSRTDAAAPEHAHATATPPASGPAYVTLDSHAELRELLGEPHPIVIDKVHPRLDPDDLDFVARSPFCLLSTSDAYGTCDASPRGGAPGFTHVVDPGTLVLPERPGNRRGDSLHNILDNPHAGLLYLVPGSRTILRVNGRARVLTDAPFFDALTAEGGRPSLAILIDISEVYLHCPQSLNRSSLWSPVTWEAEA